MWINFYGSPKCKKQEEVSERKKNHYKHYFPFASSLSTAFQLLYSVTETPNLKKDDNLVWISPVFDYTQCVCGLGIKTTWPRIRFLPANELLFICIKLI